MRLTLVLLVLVAASGCNLGSNKGYRPYKGEPRPDQEVREDPLIAEDAIKNGIPHSTLANTTYIEQSRKEVRSVLDTVKRNHDGSPRNAWKSYEDDMVATLGPGSLSRVAPKPAEKPTGPVKKPAEGEGEDAPAKKEKPADAGGEGEKKPEGSNE
jgi:hypothetical protein